MVNQSDEIPDVFIHETAVVEKGVLLESGIKIWHHSHIRENAQIGSKVTIGKNVYVGPGVVIGSSAKIQNNSQIYEPAIIERGVFVGPGVIFTNDRFPRAQNPDGTTKSHSDWEPVGVVVHQGASIGAGAVCIAPVEIGQWSMVGAGSVVTSNVPNFALFFGNPARFFGWVGKAGTILRESSAGNFICPVTNERYVLRDSCRLEIA